MCPPQRRGGPVLLTGMIVDELVQRSAQTELPMTKRVFYLITFACGNVMPVLSSISGRSAPIAHGRENTNCQSKRLNNGHRYPGHNNGQHHVNPGKPRIKIILGYQCIKVVHIHSSQPLCNNFRLGARHTHLFKLLRKFR